MGRFIENGVLGGIAREQYCQLVARPEVLQHCQQLGDVWIIDAGVVRGAAGKRSHLPNRTDILQRCKQPGDVWVIDAGVLRGAAGKRSHLPNRTDILQHCKQLGNGEQVI